MSKPKLKRTALTKPTLSYLHWRYVSNARRTWLAWQSQRSHSDHIRQVAQGIKDRGIVTGPAKSYLGEEGRRALKEASSSVKQLTQSNDLQAVLRKA